jgi:hypothetical protein
MEGFAESTFVHPVMQAKKPSVYLNYLAVEEG